MAQENVDPRQPGMTRRAFMASAAMVGATAGLSSMMSARAAEAAEAMGQGDNEELVAYLEEVYNSPKYGHSPVLSPVTVQNHFVEPPLPEEETLESLGLQSEYDVDILVIGGGLSGIYAGREAHRQGKNVLVVEKATVGKGGLTPWCHTFAYYDESLGDTKETIIELARQDGEYSQNYAFFDQFLDRSKEIYEDARAYGWLHPHDWSTTEEDGLNPAEKLQAHADVDRHIILRQGLIDEGVPFIERVMITDLLKEDGRVQGAVGFHVECSEPIVFKAKAVILCTGCGSVRPTGFPTGSSTWDGDCMAYRIGASITGKDYTDFHWTLADCPGDIYTMWWRSFEEGQLLFPAHFPSDSDMIGDVYAVDADGGFITPDRSLVVQILTDEKAGIDEAAAAKVESGTVEAGQDPRTALGNTITPDYLWLNRESKECAIGMGMPKEEGVRPADTTGFTGIDGLWTAGLSMGSHTFGASYVCMGADSVSSCLQGRVAAETVCALVDEIPAPAPSDEVVQAAVARLLEPLQREKGFSPDYAEEALCNIMAPYYVAYMKSEETLTSALGQLESLRDKITDNLHARDPHELRYCHEMKNKILNCEMRLRSGLFRTESRGMHYRFDYPYRDDANWLAWINVHQDENGEMVLEKEPIPAEWCGDLSKPYAERYPKRMPGELEALKEINPEAAASIESALAAASE